MTTLCERLDLGRPHRVLLARLRHAIVKRVARPSSEGRSARAARWFQTPGDAIRTWAMILITAVTALHLYQVICRCPWLPSCCLL